MFRLIADSFTRRPRRKLLTAAALSLSMAVSLQRSAFCWMSATAPKFRSLGANLVVTPEADSLPLEIGGVDFARKLRHVSPRIGSPQNQSVFWHNNITARQSWKLR
jgi:hypothetical protein